MSKSAAWNATRNKFIVADIETTGLSAERHEIIEIAALRVAPNGKVLDTFSTLVHAAKPIRAITTRITGITQTDIDRKGVPIGKAMSQLIAFVGDLPMFCHNAPFDCEFLGKASDVARLPFTNVVYDTIPLAKQVWPYLRSYKLAMLARRLGASAPKHRALADARSTLGVLLAARLAFDESNNSPLL